MSFSVLCPVLFCFCFDNKMETCFLNHCSYYLVSPSVRDREYHVQFFGCLLSFSVCTGFVQYLSTSAEDAYVYLSTH